ncbi:MAG: hypothetical protein ACLQKA_03525 [Bryobacteraceae bacterium]
MPRRTVIESIGTRKEEEQRLATLYAQRAALALAIRRLRDYDRLRAKRVAAGILKVA